MGELLRVLESRKQASAVKKGAFAPEEEARLFPTNAYGGRGGSFFQHIYEAETNAEPRAGGRFRWILSTCLAAAIGAIAILIVVYGSSDNEHLNDGLLPTLKSIGEGALVPQVALTPKNAGGLKWVMPKSDRLQLTTGALSTRYIIHESSKSRRDSREYVRQKPYARIVARLAPVSPDKAESIPPFNPFKIYGSGQPTEPGADPDDAAGSGLSRADVSTKVVELLGGILPEEDGQELDAQEVQDIVERSSSGGDSGSYAGDGSGAPLDGVAAAGPTLTPPPGSRLRRSRGRRRRTERGRGPDLQVRRRLSRPRLPPRGLVQEGHSGMRHHQRPAAFPGRRGVRGYRHYLRP